LLERRGHRVTLNHVHFGGRPPVDHRENAKSKLQGWSRETWSPGRITVVDIGAVFFGLTLYEISESVEVRYVDGKYVRLSDEPLSTRSRRPVKEARRD
jgi:hypothetical protein